MLKGSMRKMFEHTSFLFETHLTEIRHWGKKTSGFGETTDFDNSFSSEISIGESFEILTVAVFDKFLLFKN